jgi:hypothetical protein
MLAIVPEKNGAARYATAGVVFMDGEPDNDVIRHMIRTVAQPSLVIHLTGGFFLDT